MTNEIFGLLFVLFVSSEISASHIDSILQIHEKIESNVKPLAYTSKAEHRPKTAADIALQKCKEYAEYRYVNIWKEPDLPRQNGSWRKEMDCINVEPLIAGGTMALPKEYPHMALIGVGSNFTNVEWICGGSLISEKFVMSGAHCSTSSMGLPRWVLLGTTNVNSTNYEGKRAVYEIVKHYNHPSYKMESMDMDISLYELNATVTMSPYVRPACLYTSTQIPVNTKASISGWGATSAEVEMSVNLLKAKISVVEDGKCNKTYDVYDSKSMICAGDIVEGKDTCSGDGGGPLQIPVNNQVCMWNILGIVSRGPGICANYEDYAVYSRVPYFLNWIQSVVWP